MSSCAYVYPLALYVRQGNDDRAMDQQRCVHYTRREERFTYGKCTSIPIDKFADAISLIYKQWDEDYPYKNLLNGHFRPQIGPKSCFSNVSPSDYDAVSTIGNTAAMRKFSEHLPAHKLGLWGQGESRYLSQSGSNAHSNLYYEGQPFKVPANVLAKLKQATQKERQMLQKYL